MSTKLISFHNNPKIKEAVMTQVRDHRLKDQIIKSTYWEGGKGCAVGCTIHGNDHSAYERELGIPRLIARLEDGIFEHLPDCKAQLWPEQFLEAITPGADLDLVSSQFLLWLLVNPVDGVIRFTKRPESKKAVVAVVALYTRRLDGDEPALIEWQKVTTLAHDAAADPAAAAAYAAYAAYAPASHAAYAAAYAATIAARGDTDARRVRQSEKLIELLKAAPVVTT